MKKHKRGLVVARVAICVASAAMLLAQPGNPPKYPPCPSNGSCNQSLGNDTHNPNTANGCTGWCSNTPLKFTPDPIWACAGQAVSGINVRVDGAMDTKGNAVANGGGAVNWGDGTSEDSISMNAGPIPFNQNFTHTFSAAGTYYPSATVAQQFAYTGNGSCGYRCRSQQAVMAIVYLADSPECATGVFQATSNSEKRRVKELKKFKALLAKQ
jgi:hypothetical protein